VTILYYAKVIRGIVYSADNRRDTPSREFTAVALDSAERRGKSRKTLSQQRDHGRVDQRGR